MRAHQIPGDGQTQTRSARPRRTGKRLKQFLARPGRQAGTIVRDLYDKPAVVALGRDRDHRRTGLDRVVPQIGQHAEQLLAVGLHLDRFVDPVLPNRLAVDLPRQRGRDVAQQTAEREAAEIEGGRA